MWSSCGRTCEPCLLRAYASLPLKTAWVPFLRSSQGAVGEPKTRVMQIRRACSASGQLRVGRKEDARLTLSAAGNRGIEIIHVIALKTFQIQQMWRGNTFGINRLFDENVSFSGLPSSQRATMRR